MVLRKISAEENLAMPVNGWKTFPSTDIPKDFKYGSISQYVMESTYQYFSDTDEDSGCLPITGHNKSLRRGRISFTSGHVTNLEDIADGILYHIR